MSVRAITWALDADVGDAAAKLLLVALADHADDQTQQCWPSIGYIARRCQLSEKTVQRRLRQLERKGLIETQSRVGHSSIITLLMGTPVSVTGVTPVKQSPRSNRPLPRSDSDRTPRSLLTDRTINEPSRTLDDDETRARANPPPKQKLITDEAFALSDAIAIVCGHDPANLPVQWHGSPMTVQKWLNEGHHHDLIMTAARRLAGKKPSATILSARFFEREVASVAAEYATPMPVVQPGEQQIIPGGPNGRRLQDDKLSVSRAIDRIAERIDSGDVAAFPARPSLLPDESKSDMRLLSSGRGTRP